MHVKRSIMVVWAVTIVMITSASASAQVVYSPKEVPVGHKSPIDYATGKPRITLYKSDQHNRWPDKEFIFEREYRNSCDVSGYVVTHRTNALNLKQPIGPKSRIIIKCSSTVSPESGGCPYGFGHWWFEGRLKR